LIALLSCLLPTAITLASQQNKTNLSLLFSHISLLSIQLKPRCNAANPCSPSPAKMDGSTLKSAQLLGQMRLHLATDAGKELTKKVGLVYQLNIAPKVRPIPPRSPRIDRKVLFFFLAWTAAG
jgi:hypothetical protein